MAVRCDVTNGEEVKGLAQRALDEFGQIDVLVNNAGIAGPTAPIDKIDYVISHSIGGPGVGEWWPRCG